MGRMEEEQVSDTTQIVYVVIEDQYDEFEVVGVYTEHAEANFLLDASIGLFILKAELNPSIDEALSGLRWGARVQ